MRTQRNLKWHGGYTNKCMLSGARCSPPCCPRALTRTPGGLAGSERYFCSHCVSTLTYNLLKDVSVPGCPVPSTSSAVPVIISVMPSGIGMAVLLPTWSLLQGPTGSCTEGASGTHRTALDTGLSVKGHIWLSADVLQGEPRWNAFSGLHTGKRNLITVSFSAKNTWNLFPTHLVILKHDLKTKQNTYITFPNVILHLVISKQICYIERVLKIQFSILQTLVIHEESLSYNNIPNIKIQRSTCKPKYSSELSSQNLVFSRNVGKEAALTVRKEIKTHTSHVCLLVNWENTKSNWFLVDFLFFNQKQASDSPGKVLLIQAIDGHSQRLHSLHNQEVANLFTDVLRWHLMLKGK